MIKKQQKLIIVIAAVVIVFAVLYGVLGSILAPDETDTPPATVGNHGETMLNGRPYIYDKIDKTNVKSITVENEKGGYTIYRGVDDDFYFKGLEHVYYDEYMLSAATTNFTNVLAIQEVVGYTADELENYGLKDGAHKASFEVNTVDGQRYKVLVGNMLVNESGYYAMLEGREALYVIDTYSGVSIFAGKNEFVAPQVAYPFPSSQDIKLTSLKKIENGKHVYTVEPSIQKEADKELYTNVAYGYTLTYPETKYVSDYTFMTVTNTLQNFSGNAVVACGLEDQVKLLKDFVDGKIQIDSEEGKKVYEVIKLFNEYGLFDENYQFPVVFEFEYPVSADAKAEDVYGYLIASMPTKDNKTYIYSQAFDVIVEFDSAAVEWLYWGADRITVNSIVTYSVFDIKEMEIIHDSVKAHFVCDTVLGENPVIKKIVDKNTSKEINVDLFKQLYRGVLYFSAEGTATMPEDAQCCMTLRITLGNQDVLDYRFYNLTDRKTYYTFNGEGGFYVNRDNIKALVEYTQKTLANESFTSSQV